jgi:hypothetical protein
MMLAMDTVAWIFAIAALICLIDIFVGRVLWRKLIRLSFFLLFCACTYFYASAYISGAVIPSASLRYAIVAIPVIVIGEVISLWNVGGNKK